MRGGERKSECDFKFIPRKLVFDYEKILTDSKVFGAY